MLWLVGLIFLIVIVTSLTGKEKPLGYTTIKALENRYGCPPTTYTKVSDGLWASTNGRKLVWDPKTSKLYCASVDWASKAKGGWFYEWDPNDPMLEYS